MAMLRGWTSLGGGRYRSPGGIDVSRRQYNNARAQAVGFKSYREWQELRKDQKYLDKLDDYTQHTSVSRKEARKLESRYNETFAQAFDRQFSGGKWHWIVKDQNAANRHWKEIGYIQENDPRYPG